MANDVVAVLVGQYSWFNVKAGTYTKTASSLLTNLLGLPGAQFSFTDADSNMVITGPLTSITAVRIQP